MFYGSQRHQVDAKWRFRIPAKYKDKFGSTVFLSKGSNNCIYVFSEAGAKELLFDRFKDVGILTRNLIEVKRLIAANTFDLIEDNQGRLTIPSELVKHAGITKNIVTVGASNWLELWSEESWDEYSNSHSDFDGLMSNLVEQL